MDTTCAVTGKKYNLDDGSTKCYITVTKGGSGFFAVEVHLNEENKELGSFWEPWTTGNGRYETKEEAQMEAKQWATDDELPCLL